jgi:hypothetical protein
MMIIMKGEKIEKHQIYEIDKMEELIKREEDMNNVKKMKENKLMMKKKEMKVRDVKKEKWVKMVKRKWRDVEMMNKIKEKDKVIDIL